MKKTIIQIIALFSLYFTITSFSCKKNTTDTSGILVGTLNGATWSANSITTTDSTVGGVRQLMINARSTANNQIISIGIVRYAGFTCTYPVKVIDSNTYAVTDYYASGNTHIGNVGQVVINEATTHHVKGTFNFTTTDTITISDGHFDINY